MEIRPPSSDLNTDAFIIVSKEHLKRLEEALQVTEILSLPKLTELSPGRLIRIFRAVNGITSSALAKKANIDRGHLGLLEKDKHLPNATTIKALTKIFGPKFEFATKATIESQSAMKRHSKRKK